METFMIGWLVMGTSILFSAGLVTIWIVTYKRIQMNLPRMIYTVFMFMLFLGLIFGGGLYPLWLWISPSSNAAIWRAVMIFLCVPPVLILTAVVTWKYVGADLELFTAEAVDLGSKVSFVSISPTYIDEKNIRRIAPYSPEEWLGKTHDPAIFTEGYVEPYKMIIRTGITLPAGTVVELNVYPVYSILNLSQKKEITLASTKELQRRMFGDEILTFEEERTKRDDLLYIPDRLYGLEPKAVLQDYASRSHICSNCSESFSKIVCPKCKVEIPRPPLVGVAAMREISQTVSRDLGKQIVLNTKFEFTLEIKVRKIMHKIATLYAKIRDKILDEDLDKSLTTEASTIDSEIESLLTELESSESPRLSEIPKEGEFTDDSFEGG